MPARPVRVLHVVEAIETGCARHLADLVTHTTTTEHHLAIPAERRGGHTDHGAIAACETAGAALHRVEMRRSTSSVTNVAALRQVRRLIRRLEPDVVHGHSSIGGVVARVAAAGTGARRVYTPHGLATGATATAVERLLGPLTHRMIAVSAGEADEASARHLVDRDRITVIVNGIDQRPPAPRSLREAAGVPAGVPLVGSMGRLVPQKAPAVLLDAWSRVAAARADTHFVLIGDGDDAARRAVREAMSTRPLTDRLHWLPFLPGAAAYLGDLDVFVLTSTFEGGPYAPLEAMRAGVAVVLTDVVGSHDTVENGRSGLLTPMGDPAATAAAIGSLLADPGRRSALAAGGIAQVARFDVAVMGCAYDALYAELTALPRRPRRQPSHP